MSTCNFVTVRHNYVLLREKVSPIAIMWSGSGYFIHDQLFTRDHIYI